MFLKKSIKKKLIAWFLISLIIFSGTMLVLYLNVRQIVKIPEQIVSKNLEISSQAKKMVEYLLDMEEYEKKYHLLDQTDYRSLFFDAAGGYETSLLAILDLSDQGFRLAGPWEALYTDFNLLKLPEINATNAKESLNTWISENSINDWIQRISDGLYENEQEIFSATQTLKRKRESFARNVVIGIAVSCLVGLVFAVFLSYSILRPLRELRNGIRSVSTAKASEPIRVRSSDEFGELAGAFNQMTAHLMEEEQMRSDFISMLSHEIRTPLTSIQESVNMITEEVMGPINTRQRKFLTIAGSEIGRISDLLKHLMQMSRMQSGAVKIQPRPLDTPRFISECVQRMHHAAENKGILIETDIPQDLPKLMGDPDHLPHVFVNLIGNAVKFSGTDTRVIVRAAMKGRKQLAFYVVDQGPGIPDDEQSLIFNKYYRARSVRNHMDGVGLGLTISKHIIEVHRGWLWVKSKIGEGSTFGVILPAAP